MPFNPAVNDPEKFEQIVTDAAYTAQFLQEYRQLIAAAREVTYQRFHADPDNAFGKMFPTVSQAIFQLSNLVGTPLKDRSS